MKFLNSTVLNNISIGASANSAAIDASFMLNVSLIAQVTGSSPVGVLSIQGSNDIPPSSQAPNSGFTPTNWNNFVTANVGATGTFVIPKTDTCYRWIRVRYARTSGSGNITAEIKTNGM